MHYIRHYRLLVMIKYIVVAFIFLSCSSLKRQQFKGVEAYAYRQSVVPGIVSKGVIDESGKEVTIPRKPIYNMWIYLVAPPQVSLQGDEVYIQGVLHKIKAEVIDSTPVTHTSYTTPDRPKKTELVPKTSGTVYLLTPAETVTVKPASHLKKAMMQNEVVIGYTIENKKYYTTVKKIIQLEPAVAQ